VGVVSLMLVRREPAPPQSHESSHLLRSSAPFPDRASGPIESPRGPAPIPSNAAAPENSVVSPEDRTNKALAKSGAAVVSVQRTASPPRPAELTPNNPLDDSTGKAQVGRFALAFVGANPEAEEVWLWVINDPSVSAHVRQDLIEDLNEDGFSDPKHPTVDDLPLVERRIALIEQVAPDAMDEANFAAFAEAYKDLINIWARLTQE